MNRTQDTHLSTNLPSKRQKPKKGQSFYNWTAWDEIKYNLDYIFWFIVLGIATTFPIWGWIFLGWLYEILH